MIMADSFCQSDKARYNEFSTTTNDTPLIVQFSAKDGNEFVDASKLVYSYADGVDLNCGCPQRWAIKDGYGCALLSKPDIIYSLVRNFKNNFPNTFTISVKIRLLKDIRKSIELCQNLEKCGINFITIHARTPTQKSSEPINVEALKIINNVIQVPVIANGGVKSLNDADTLYNNTHCAGIMAASGILINPALFSGANETPVTCIRQWMKVKNRNKDKITFQCYHHHLVFMLEKRLSKKQKNIFNYLSTFETVDDFLVRNVITCECDLNVSDEEFIICDYPNEVTQKYSKCVKCSRNQYLCICEKNYDSNCTSGKYFSSYIDKECDVDFLDSNSFINF